MLAADPRGRRRAAARAREARRDRLVHHRQLPPRPRPDEGDHRRGHARGELVRRHAHRHDPRGLRADRRRSSTRRRPTATFKPEIEARFAAMAFYGAIEQLLTGWIFELLPAGRGGLRAGQVARRRDGLRRPGDARDAVVPTGPPRAIDSCADGERDGQATDLVRPARRRRRAREHRRAARRRRSSGGACSTRSRRSERPAAAPARAARRDAAQHRRRDHRGLRARAGARARGDRARQGRGHREGDASWSRARSSASPPACSS